MVKIPGAISVAFIFLLILLSSSCRENYTPKPAGYVKIDFPEKKYRLYGSNPAFSFEYPQYAVIHDSSSKKKEGWLNMEIPSLNGTIYLSYSKLNKDLNTYVEDSRSLAYKHTIKATSIDELLIRYPENSVYGIFYDIKGNTATSIQFFLTDSVNHFLRGSLYFYTQPNQDSLAPVISFVRKDIEHMIETFRWK